MKENSFILWLIGKRAENKIFGLAFVIAVTGYSFWKPIGNLLRLSEEGAAQIYYVCISVSFFFYTFAYFLTKYDKWRWFPMFVTMICGSRAIQEIFYPQLAVEYDWLEYLYFVITIFVVFFYYVKHQYNDFISMKKF